MRAANAYAITLARELRQLSQETLSRNIGVTQGTLSKVENEQIPANSELVAKLARALRVPESFFYQNVEYRNLPQTFFRKYNVNQTSAKGIRARISVLREQLKTLLHAVEIAEDRIPQVSLEDHSGSIETLAREVRAYWNVKPGPLGNLTLLLERMGVLIVECDFGTGKVDAVSLRDAELPPCIFINPCLPTDRWRFTLAHELAHLILHHGRFIVADTSDIEGEAHRFAAAFLMPAKDIAGQFIGRLTLDKLAAMKAHWKVSMQALVMRAADLNRITDSQKRRLFMQMGKMGYRRDEPVDLPREEPTLASALLKYHLTQLGYSVSQLSASLHVLEDELYALYPRAIRKPLRLVE